MPTDRLEEFRLWDLTASKMWHASGEPQRHPLHKYGYILVQDDSLRLCPCSKTDSPERTDDERWNFEELMYSAVRMRKRGEGRGRPSIDYARERLLEMARRDGRYK